MAAGTEHEDASLAPDVVCGLVAEALRVPVAKVSCDAASDQITITVARRRPLAEVSASTATLWPSVGAAVAILTAELADDRDLQADILDGLPSETDVLTVMAVITGCLLKAVWPADEGVPLLQRLGLRALERADAQSEGPR